VDVSTIKEDWIRSYSAPEPLLAANFYGELSNWLMLVKFKRTIRRSGGSAAIAVPPEILNALDWKIGDSVELYADEQKLIIKKV
jgi:hypothetical protein